MSGAGRSHRAPPDSLAPAKAADRAAHRLVSDWSNEETDEPLVADHRNFYKVEKWSRGGERVTELLFAGSSLDKAKRVFDRWAKHRPRIRMTIRQRTRVLYEWPRK
jgi:hypothetical protein